MAFLAKNVAGNNQPSNQSIPSNSPNELDSPQLEFILKILGDVDLKGRQVEMFYNLIVKLQNQYIEKTK